MPNMIMSQARGVHLCKAGQRNLFLFVLLLGVAVAPADALISMCAFGNGDRPRGRGDWSGQGRGGGRGSSRGRGSMPQRPAPEFRTRFAETRVFVENLTFETEWTDLKDHFKRAGYPTVYASVSTDRDTGRSKGCGIVQFETVHAALDAIEHMTGSLLDGRSINCRPDAQEQSRRRPDAPRDAAPRRDGRDAFARGGGFAPSRPPRARENDRFGPSTDRRGGGERGAVGRGVPRTGSADEAGADAWKTRPWSRIAGTEDDFFSQMNEERVLELLAQRDAARDIRDFDTADTLLDELAMMRVYVDDARRQRKWWVGRRADGGERGERGGERGGGGGGRGKGRGGSTAGQSRRAWFRGDSENLRGR